MSACRDLPTLRQGVCGNGVVDPGEDCDAFAPEGKRCGRPQTPVACRFECVRSPAQGDPVCPAGWQCGNDSICRAATGAFAPMGIPIEAAVERVLLGDFQGSGRASVLGLGGANAAGAAYARLFFLQDDGSALESSLLGFPVTSPHVGDLNGDGRDDFVFSVLGGLGVMLGQSAEDLVPVSYPLLTLQKGARTLAIPIQPHPLSMLNQMTVIFVSFEGHAAIEALEEANYVITTLPHPHERLAGEPVVADIIRDPSAPCGELLFGYRDAPEVWLVQPCRADGSWSDPQSSLQLAATLPDGHVVQSGAFVADFDRDGELDLLVGADGGKSFVARGCGQGRFCSDKSDETTAGQLQPVQAWYGAACSDEPIAAPGLPIAVGDVNGDGVPDVVTPSDVMVVKSVNWDGEQASVEVCPAATKLVGRWTTAKVVDLTLDGRPDVVAGSAEGLDLEFYTGTGLDRLNLTRITTPSPVSKLSVGDFDGDLVPDLAVGLLGTAKSDALAISYGRVHQPPEPLVSVASFATIDQVVAAHFDYSDGVEELGVVALNDEDMQTVTVFLSSGGRQLLAPFGLIGAPAGPSPEAEVEGSPLSIALDDYNGDSHLDVASFALVGSTCTSNNCKFRLWVTPAYEEAELSSSAFGPELPDEVQPLSTSEEFGVEIAAFAAAWDVDTDGLRDVLLLAPWKPDSNESAVWWAKLDEADMGLGTAQLLTRGPVRLFAKSYPVVADLDGDEQPDVLALGMAAGDRQLVTAWGSAGIDLSHPEVFSLPEEPLGFALIQADTDDLLELIVTGQESVYLMQRGPAAPRQWEPRRIEGMDGGTSVAARDIDGDGIDDIAIADELGVRTYRGKAAVP
ncbi:MAG: FG-GAP repeat domain-containing protein [Myxococcota bacterium]